MNDTLHNGLMIEFFVHGVPVAKGSTRAFVPKGHERPIITSTARGLAAWSRLIADAAQSYAHMFEAGVGVELTFHMPRPKSLPKSKPKPMTSRPDADKLLRAALDALTGIFYSDDSRVTDVHVYKRYATVGGPVGVEVRLWEPDLLKLLADNQEARG
jgi:crossover junction endodeoxyribonuclease RusA